MSLEIGDKVQVGNVTGNIVSVHNKRRIGFHLPWVKDTSTTYDVGLSNVPEDMIVLVEKSTDFSKKKTKKEDTDGTD